MTKRMILAVWLGAIFLFLGMFTGLNISIFIIYNTALLSIYLFDYKISPSMEYFKVQRTYEGSFEMGMEKIISLKVTTPGDRNIIIELRDTPPLEMESDNPPLTLSCMGKGTFVTCYMVGPIKRGNFSFGSVFVRCPGVLGLCTKEFQFSCSETVPVYPDLYTMKKYHLLSGRNLLHYDDGAAHRVYGIGTDFQYLRDYTPGDEYRKINWNATARSHKLITGVFDIEKSQDVIICIDIGRTMMSKSGIFTRLDHSIESALVLAQVAIDKGDRVGLLIFGSDAKLYLKPAKGTAGLSSIVKALYSLQPEYYESNYNELVSCLSAHQRKRSLVCIFSNPGDEENCREIASSLKPLIQRHTVLMISILNPGLGRIINTTSKDVHDAYAKAAASYRLDTKQSASTIMSRLGIPNIMAEPERLTPEIVNRYISIKKSMGIG